VLNSPPPVYQGVFSRVLHLITMYQLQILREGEWNNTAYMPTVWETAQRRITYYRTAFPYETYSLLRVK